MSKIENFKIGDSAYIEKSFSYEDVKLFSELSLDNNPVHLDSEFAANSIFKQKILHGMLYSSLISAVLGTKLPGPGSIYMKQETKYLKPVFINEKVKAICTIKSINLEKSIIELTTQCFKNESELVVDGTALIKVL